MEGDMTGKAKKVELVKPVKSTFECNQEEVIWFLSEGLIDRLKMCNLSNTSLGNTCIWWNNSWLLSLSRFAFKSRSYELAQILTQGHRVMLNPGYIPHIPPQTEPRELLRIFQSENQNGRLPVVEPKMLCLTPCGWKTSLTHLSFPVKLCPGDLCST